MAENTLDNALNGQDGPGGLNGHAQAAQHGKRGPLSKDDILAAIGRVAQELGRAPTRQEFLQMAGIHHGKVTQHFRGYRAAVRAAGLLPHPGGLRVGTAAMLEDWGALARRLGRVPTRDEYDAQGRYSTASLEKRCRRWSEVRKYFLRSLEQGGLESSWQDVAELVRNGPVPKRGGGKRWLKKYVAGEPGTLAPDGVTILPPPLWGKKRVTATMLELVFEAARVKDGPPADGLLGPFRPSSPSVSPLAPAPHDFAPSAIGLRQLPREFGSLARLAAGVRRVFPDRPLMGAPLLLPGLAHAPVNEMEVVLLFGMLAAQLGFIVESVRTGFPDCEARLEVEPGRWQRVKIEFERESINFRDHKHDPAGCDMIVCWKHNWPGCPEHIRVLELESVVKELLAHGF